MGRKREMDPGRASWNSPETTFPAAMMHSPGQVGRVSSKGETYNHLGSTVIY